MADNPRIEELRRRVLADPASIAFAALAEEYRRSGNYADAIETCRIGLQRHPSYLSARVTLGRALIETAQYDDARRELEQVLKSAPENLAAIRGLAEIHERQGSLDHDYRDALAEHQTLPVSEAPPALVTPAADAAAAERPAASKIPEPVTSQAPVAPPAASAVATPRPVLVSPPPTVVPAPPAPVVSSPSPAPVAEAPPTAAAPVAARPAAVTSPAKVAVPPVAAPDPVVVRLEQFLVAIRSARTSSPASR